MWIEYAAGHLPHRQKALTLMNLQVHHVISAITGWTGMPIVRAIVDAERDCRRRAALRDVRTQADEATMAKSRQGDYRAEHVFAWKQSLQLFDADPKQIQECDPQIAAHRSRLESKADGRKKLKAARREKNKRRTQSSFPIREQVFRITGVDRTEIDGIRESAALARISEIGTDRSRWKTETHLASGLALGPNNKISGSQLFQRSTRKTANRARDILR